MTRKLSPEKLEARKGRRIAHTKRDIWPLGMESDELISDAQLDAAFAELGAKRLPGLDRRETVEALALRVVCRIPMSTGHRNLLLKLDLLLESRLEVYQLVLKQKGIRLVQAMSRQAEHRIMLNSAEADRAYGLECESQPTGKESELPPVIIRDYHNVNTCHCKACYTNRLTVGLTSASDLTPCQCRLCQESGRFMHKHRLEHEEAHSAMVAHHDRELIAERNRSQKTNDSIREGNSIFDLNKYGKDTQ